MTVAHACFHDKFPPTRPSRLYRHEEGHPAMRPVQADRMQRQDLHHHGETWNESAVVRRERHHPCGGHKHTGNRGEDRIGITYLFELHQRRRKQEKRPKP